MSIDFKNLILVNSGNPKPQPIDLEHQKPIDKKFEKLKKAAQSFEAIFIGQILQSMRRSVNSGLFGSGAGSQIYNSMFDENIAKAIASKDGFGLSDIIIRSLHKEGGQNNSMTGAALEDYWLRPVHRISTQKVDRNWDRSIIAEAAQKFDVDSKLVQAIIKVESDYNAKAVSSKGAVGLMQLIKSTADELGVKNRYDPRQNIFGGTRYFKMQLDHFDGDLELALSAYNAGPAAVQKYKGVPPFEETQRYVQKVLQASREM